MGSRRLPELVASVEYLVRNAQNRWDPSSPAGCEECCQALAAAAQELQALQAEAGRSRTGSLKSVRERLRQIRAEVDQLARQVDAAAAFCRGLTRVIGQNTGAPPFSGPETYLTSEGQA